MGFIIHDGTRILPFKLAPSVHLQLGGVYITFLFIDRTLLLKCSQNLL